MSALSFAFLNPWLLAALVALPAIWWLLRLTPPKPVVEVFPPLRILAGIVKREETPSKSPWWLTLLRTLMAALLILAIADPVFNPRARSLDGSGPLVIAIDNSWATAEDWERRVATAEALIAEAEDTGVPVSISFTADREHDATPAAPELARTRLAAARPQPLSPDRDRAVTAIAAALDGTRPGTLAFLTDNIAPLSGDDPAMAKLAALNAADLRIVEAEADAPIAFNGAANGADAMTVTATRIDNDAPLTTPITAYDARGRSIATGAITFGEGDTVASGTLAAPFELRNDFARIGLDGAANAGAALLLDDGFRRRRVALLSGEARDLSQPLLSPLYYINRALSPYADLVDPNEADLAVAIPKLLEDRPSVIIMADIGRLPEETYPLMRRWIENGGTLIRFAGPRLAAAPAEDPLVPVTLRQGERALGGALSWSDPQPLADYPAASPFAGMRKPEGILVRRQVLAEPTADLPERTWASLADGTPLVTTTTEGSGRIVLFHVSAEATWSNLPISGDFVEMLRRTVQLSRGGGVGSTETAQILNPYRLLNADGVLTGEIGAARPLEISAGAVPAASPDNPPGLYGTEDGFTALNLLPAGTELRPLDRTALGAYRAEPLIGTETWSLKPWLFTLALFLLLADCLIVLFMGGALAALRRARRPALAALVIGLAALPLLDPVPQARADDSRPGDEKLLQSLDKTHLAYVVTGDAEVDRISERGLAGLTDFLTYRTTLEPGAPAGVDIASDELSVYPIIYWAISSSAPMPSPQAISRIDAYMRAGGTVLFDTRDQFSTLNLSGATSPNTQRLQDILANLDIPPLEPVPVDHVLTKAFYLLTNFPGRFNGSPLWIEAQPASDEQTGRPARSGDGVSPIMITGNDFAGAWAIDANGASLLPTVPPDELQREHAFRAGVNIMMYMLTGNYKADQVHVPALLERLGQ
ncbi:DUF4159 domain-containing protein [Ensifer soli]|uniref:DUF4159 domain-containing protein n=1 Tax=Ciceribacter sp. sgz301302 TaxID=3342379 RepID=UPI0035BB4957